MIKKVILSLVVALTGGEQVSAQEGLAATDDQIQVLIQELGSDRYAVREVATKSLMEMGDAAIPAVEKARKQDSVEVRYRAEVILECLKNGPLLKLRKQLANFATGGTAELDVEQGMYLLSLILDDQVKQADISRQLDEIAAKVRDRLGKEVNPAKSDPKKAVDALRQVLFSDLGFGPNEADYSNPCNCSLAKILETKKGRPVFMCHLMIAVARRLEIPIVGVPVSGKYLVKYDGARAPAGFTREDIYVHAYDKGRILSREDRRREYPSHDPEVMVPPDSSREVLDRMLNNLATTLDSRELPGDALRRQLVSEFSQLLEQNTP